MTKFVSVFLLLYLLITLHNQKFAFTSVYLDISYFVCLMDSIVINSNWNILISIYKKIKNTIMLFL